jgi:hypothetical protein
MCSWDTSQLSEEIFIASAYVKSSVRSYLCCETCQIIYEYYLALTHHVATINERLPVRI